MHSGVSVIICCYNSAKRLPETLRHLALQEVPTNIPWEVIVVNNASTDDTVQVAEQEWTTYNLSVSFRILDQPNPGLSNARDKGFEVATYEYCLFCDDDNWLQKDYVRIAFETMESDPMIGAAGGQGEPIFEGGKPIWFNDKVWGYAIGKQLPKSGYVDRNKGKLFGAGLIVNKKKWESLKLPFETMLCGDRTGLKLQSGGDTELCFIMVVNGYKLFYNEDLKFKHLIEKKRLDISYYKKMCQGIGQAGAILSPYKYYLDGAVSLSSPMWLKDLLYISKGFINCINKEKIVKITTIHVSLGYIKEVILLRGEYDKRIKTLTDYYQK